MLHCNLYLQNNTVVLLGTTLNGLYLPYLMMFIILGPRELLKNVPDVHRSVIEPFADFLIQESRIQTTSFLAEGVISLL